MEDGLQSSWSYYCHVHTTQIRGEIPAGKDDSRGTLAFRKRSVLEDGRDEDSDEFRPAFAALPHPSLFLSFRSAPSSDLPTNATKQSLGPFYGNACLDCYFLAVWISVQEMSGILTDPVCVTAGFFPFLFSISIDVSGYRPSRPIRTPSDTQAPSWSNHLFAVFTTMRGMGDGTRRLP